MGVNLKEILEKYDTEFDVNDIPDIVLSIGTNEDDVTIDDVEEPKILEKDEGIEYMFKAKKHIFYIDNFLNTYTGSTLWEDEYGMKHTMTILENGHIINT